MTKIAPSISNHPFLAGTTAAVALALVAAPAYAQEATTSKTNASQLDRRTAEIQGSIEEECPPVGAVAMPVSSEMAAPLEYGNPIVTSGTQARGKGATREKGVKGSARELDCPAPILTYVAEAPLAPVEEYILPLASPAVAGAGAPLWLAGLPLGVLPFVGGGVTPVAVAPPGPPSPPVPPGPPPPPVPPIPEPSTWLMMILGFFAVGIAIRRAPARRNLALNRC